MVLAAEGRMANDSHADCYQDFCVPEYGTANGRLHFHAVHFMRTLPTGSVDPNFGRRVRNRRQLNSLQNPQRQKLKFLPLRRYNLTLNLLSRSHDRIASGRQIAINGHIKFNLTIPLQQLNGLETLVIIMVANKYAFLQITRRRFLNEWEAFKKVISRRNIRRRITIPLTLSNLKLLRRITRTENILHRNFTRRQVAIQNRVASNIGISQSTFSVKVLNLFSRSRLKTNKRKSKHSAMLRNKETRHRMFIGLL